MLLLNGISNGAAYLNYIGHAGIDRLSKDGLLMSSDVNLMTNETRFPIVTAMTCVVGQFSIPGYDSLAEELVLRPKGGAVAVWAPSGISIDAQAVILDNAFFQEILKEAKPVLGDVILNALKVYQGEGGEPYMMDIYNLLGDPALRMRGN